MRWFALLLVAWSAQGQLPVVPLPQSKPNTAITPATLGARYWWAFEDNPTNVNVTNWLDRIAGFALTNGANSLRPTNSSTGVGFNGSTYLTNINPFIITCGAPGCQTTTAPDSTNGSLWVIMSAQVSTLSGLVTEETAGGKGLFTVATKQLEWFGGANTIFANYQTGTPIDIGVCVTNSGSVVNSYFTNGVLAAQHADGLANSPESNVGSYGSSGGSSPFTGKITDVVYFSRYLSQGEITSLHTYAQTRGVTP